MTSHIQPEASLEKNLIDFLLKKPVYISTGHARELKDFIHQAIEEAVETERKRIEEAVIGRKSKPTYGAYTTQDAKIFWEGKDSAFDEVIEIIHHQE